MLQGDEGTIQWDPLTIESPLPLFSKIHVIFLVIALLVTVAKLVKLWIGAPPFALKRQANSPAYLRQVHNSRASLKQWLGCALIGLGIVAAQSTREISGNLLQGKALRTTR